MNVVSELGRELGRILRESISSLKTSKRREMLYDLDAYVIPAIEKATRYLGIFRNKFLDHLEEPDRSELEKTLDMQRKVLDRIYILRSRVFKW